MSEAASNLVRMRLVVKAVVDCSYHRMRRMSAKSLTEIENSRLKIFCWTRVTRIFQKSVFTENTSFAGSSGKGPKSQ
jgi:hypothetical protein